MKKLYVKRETKEQLTAGLIRLLVIIPILYVILYPLFTMVSDAIKDQFQMMDPSVAWIPKEPTFENFKKAWIVLEYPISFARTLEINVLSALIEVVSCSLVAYGIARFEFRLKKVFLALLILNIVVPIEMIAVPTFLQLQYADLFGILGGLGKLIGKELRPSLINTPFSFWIPSLLGVGLRSGFFIFIYMQFFKGLPRELEEAAYIDGAGPVKTFLRIIIPSSATAMLTVTIFSVIWHWNDYYLSSLYFSSKYPLAVQLADIDNLLSIHITVDSVTTRNGIVMAASLLFILPMLAMYLILQKKFVKSIDSVGIVG